MRNGSRWCVLGVVASLAGCNLSMTPPDDSAMPTEDVTWTTDTPLPLTDGQLSGRVGEIANLEAQEPLLRGYEVVGQMASVELHVLSASGAAMAGIVIAPGVDAAALVPGARFHDDVDSWAAGTPEDPAFDVIGCAGPSEGDWAYDEGADDVDVAVSDDDADGRLELTFTATFAADRTTTGRAETVVGRFEVSR